MSFGEYTIWHFNGKELKRVTKSGGLINQIRTEKRLRNKGYEIQKISWNFYHNK